MYFFLGGCLLKSDHAIFVMSSEDTPFPSIMITFVLEECTDLHKLRGNKNAEVKAYVCSFVKLFV